MNAGGTNIQVTERPLQSWEDRCSVVATVSVPLNDWFARAVRDFCACFSGVLICRCRVLCLWLCYEGGASLSEYLESVPSCLEEFETA